ncbi:hypothetical protein HUV48_12070 [Altererythrobacter sp. HHU K3-1]|uniref:EF-hand domain-containing protein n=2 Tax=Qipengyuania atrilutea TaxID=2744473 RepID=A0A850H1A6_9SPHN|nr:hypothetical protein [Actirhodobacter atriluteus]
MFRIIMPAALFAFGTAAVAQQSEAGEEPLSRSDFIAQMDTEYARYDGDSNGVLTPEEIVSTQRQAARNEALRQNARVFAGLDTDGNGVLTSAEFAALANPDAIPVDAAPMLNQFDSDKDGVITLVEYRIATQGNFDRIDTDRDGIVTTMEMRAAGIAK